jgi:hypothetical protein
VGEVQVGAIAERNAPPQLSARTNTRCLRNALAWAKTLAVPMQNPFAVAVQWPDEPRRYLVHMQRPYFAAVIVETVSAAWLLVSWSPAQLCDESERASLFRAAAGFCRAQLDQIHIPIEFVERKHGYHLPRFLMAQAVGKELFIVEPDHPAPLVEVRDSDPGLSKPHKAKLSQRFDVVTQWRLEQMRNYYQQFLERQQKIVAAPSASFIT